MIIDRVDINIDPLLKAFRKFESFRLDANTEREQAGAIQAFEYTFDLIWKLMKRLLWERGKTAYSPKTVFRMAVLEDFIEDPELWFLFLKKRDMMVLVYQEEGTEEVLKVLPDFSREVKRFLDKIGVPEDALGN